MQFNLTACSLFNVSTSKLTSSHSIKIESVAVFVIPFSSIIIIVIINVGFQSSEWEREGACEEEGTIVNWNPLITPWEHVFLCNINCEFIGFPDQF